MIDGSRENDMRSRMNMNQMAKYGMDDRSMGMYQYGYNDYYQNAEDEPLENYLAVQDADAVTLDKNYIPADYYHTETIPYDGRLSPDTMRGYARNDDDMEFYDEDDDNMLDQVEMRNTQNDYDERGGYRNYEERNDPRKGAYRGNNYNEVDDPKSRNPPRPKTSNRYGVDSSYYLDDPNY